MAIVEQSLDFQYSNSIHDALDELPYNFTITDPCISGHVIVFASRGFLKMLGYSKEEVVGKSGRMFQGPRTNRSSVMEIREAIREERAVQISILNYCKSGTPVWMLFHMSPVFRNEDGRVTHFVGVQVPIVEKSSGLRSKVRRDSVEFLAMSCRREVCCSDPVMESSCGLDFGEGEKFEDSCQTSEQEKQTASNAMNNILSLLNLYSELTGKSVSGKRCNILGASILSSAITISLGRINQCFVLYDPHMLNLPIVYANDAFLTMSGYARHELLGCSRKLLCGLGTNPSTLALINESVKMGQPCKARILYYRKDQSSFWSLLYISPVRNASGKIAYFVEVQIEEENDCRNQEVRVLSLEKRQLGAIGAVKVAVRTP